MLIYIPNNSTRDQSLIAYSLSKEYAGTILYFESKDIYEIALNTKDNVCIVLNEFNTKDIFIDQFLNDFQHHPRLKTFIFILTSNNNIKSSCDNIVYIPKNTYRCFNEYYVPTSTKASKNFILCHLDCQNYQNNERLQLVLYPYNKNIPVKLVGCPNVQHVQNLGIVNEQEMLDLISECSMYIDISDQYAYDAIIMQKPVLSIFGNEYCAKVDQITMDEIENLQNNYNNKNIQNLYKYKISNIIKHFIKL